MLARKTGSQKGQARVARLSPVIDLRARFTLARVLGVDIGDDVLYVSVTVGAAGAAAGGGEG